MNKHNLPSLTLALSLTLGMAVSVKASSLTTDASSLIISNQLEEGGASYTLTDPTATFQATSDLVTSIPNIATGASFGSITGANTFYNNGITGQGAVIANVEAGVPWNQHETLTGVTTFVASNQTYGGGAVSSLYDRHATWVGSVLAGNAGSNSADYQKGIAYGATLDAGAIATAWTDSAYSNGFSINSNTFNTAYQAYFGTANVINSSWGFTDTSGSNFFTIALDGFANSNSSTTFVRSSGNSGPGINTVGSPASGYNGISVAALQNDGSNNYTSISNFSSRGPQDYSDPVNGTKTGVRSGVDITAPGTDITAAYYGGQTGGNNPTLSGSPNGPTGSTSSYSGVAGTSFSSPIVAAAATLLDSASINTPSLNIDSSTRDARVIKAVLLNSADKPADWNNGQVANALGGVDTTQALDYTYGTGILNANEAYKDYVNAQTKDVAGLGGGNVGAVGFDLGALNTVGSSNLYMITQTLAAGTNFTATLDWFRNRTYNATTSTTNDISEANLDLALIDLSTGQTIATSASMYNNTEHFSFTLPRTSQYEIKVIWTGNLFGPTTTPVSYGLAWRSIQTIGVPEPLTIAGSASGLFLLGFFQSRTKKKARSVK